jgi:hypothetical protein
MGNENDISNGSSNADNIPAKKGRLGWRIVFFVISCAISLFNIRFAYYMILGTMINAFEADDGSCMIAMDGLMYFYFKLIFSIIIISISILFFVINNRKYKNKYLNIIYSVPLLLSITAIIINLILYQQGFIMSYMQCVKGAKPPFVCH